MEAVRKHKVHTSKHGKKKNGSERCDMLKANRDVMSRFQNADDSDACKRHRLSCIRTVVCFSTSNPCVDGSTVYRQARARVMTCIT